MKAHLCVRGTFLNFSFGSMNSVYVILTFPVALECIERLQSCIEQNFLIGNSLLYRAELAKTSSSARFSFANDLRQRAIRVRCLLLLPWYSNVTHSLQMSGPLQPILLDSFYVESVKQFIILSEQAKHFPRSFVCKYSGSHWKRRKAQTKSRLDGDDNTTEYTTRPFEMFDVWLAVVSLGRIPLPRSDMW